MKIGIDLGGTKIEGILLAKDNSVLAKVRTPSPKNNYAATLSALCDVVNILQEKAGAQATVGIGTPGALSLHSGVMKNSNSTHLNGQPLQQDIEAQLGYGIKIENDANCFTLSEAHLGVAKTSNIVFGVIIGTGSGGGLVVNKQLLNGANNISGEWGHNALPSSARYLIDADRHCYCGRKNCIETVLSGSGLCRTFHECYAIECTASEIADLANNGDTAATECLSIYCQQMACCLATVVNIVDPDIIVLGGGLSNISQLYEDVINFMRPQVFTDTLRTVIARPSFGDASGALGAACLWS